MASTPSLLAGILALLALSACDQAAPPPVPDAPAEASRSASPPSVPTDRAPGASDEARPDLTAAPLTPAPLTPGAERTEKGARNLLLAFARALELEEWDQAWRMLSAEDRTALPRERWAAQFADLDDVTVAVPAGRLEGAAGSSYYTAPVTITATDAAGRQVRYEGEAVLRRANDVDGATEAQRRWRFARLTLDWTH